MGYKEDFIKIYNENIARQGSQELLNWLQNTDFFTTPASTQYHYACECGLVMHCLSVYEVLMEKHFDENIDSKESFTICALLHDICKTQFYKTGMRNVKNDAGVWVQQPFYKVEDTFPFGHGEKSVFLIERFMRLKTYEAMAIRWHMGGFDDSVKAGSFSLGIAFDKFPLAVKMHLADLESTYLREKRA